VIKQMRSEKRLNVMDKLIVFLSVICLEKTIKNNTIVCRLRIKKEIWYEDY